MPKMVLPLARTPEVEPEPTVEVAWTSPNRVMLPFKFARLAVMTMLPALPAVLPALAARTPLLKVTEPLKRTIFPPLPVDVRFKALPFGMLIDAVLSNA